MKDRGQPLLCPHGSNSPPVPSLVQVSVTRALPSKTMGLKPLSTLHPQGTSLNSCSNARAGKAATGKQLSWRTGGGVGTTRDSETRACPGLWDQGK
jgi:hypothetical protein